MGALSCDHLSSYFWNLAAFIDILKNGDLRKAYGGSIKERSLLAAASSNLARSTNGWGRPIVGAVSVFHT